MPLFCFSLISQINPFLNDLGLLPVFTYYILSGSFPEVAPHTHMVCKSQALLLGTEYGISK